MSGRGEIPGAPLYKPRYGLKPVTHADVQVHADTLESKESDLLQ